MSEPSGVGMSKKLIFLKGDKHERRINIPLEGEKGLIGFYDTLKKLKVSFAELPDLWHRR